MVKVMTMGSAIVNRELLAEHLDEVIGFIKRSGVCYLRCSLFTRICSRRHQVRFDGLMDLDIVGHDVVAFLQESRGGERLCRDLRCADLYAFF